MKEGMGITSIAHRFISDKNTWLSLRLPGCVAYIYGFGCEWLHSQMIQPLTLLSAVSGCSVNCSWTISALYMHTVIQGTAKAVMTDPSTSCWHCQLLLCRHPYRMI